MDNFSQQQSGQSQGQASGPSPFQGNVSGGNAPVSPKVDIRTMVSDAASIQESGGAGPKSYTPTVEPKAPVVSAPATPAIPPTLPVSPSPFGAAASPMSPAQSTASNQASSPIAPSYTPPPFPSGGSNLGGAPFVGSTLPPTKEPIKSAPSSLTPIKEKQKGGGKGIFALLFSLIIVAGIGAAVYFFVVPIFQKSSDLDNTTSGTQDVQDTSGQPSDDGLVSQDLPILPAETVADVSTTTDADGQAASVVSDEAASENLPIVHKSLLKTAADLSEDIKLQDLSVSGIRSAISFSTADVPSLKEIVLRNAEDNALSFAQVAGALSPQVFNDDTIKMFEADFTLLIYTDQKGSWPVYILKSPVGVRAADVEPKIKGLETAEGGVKNFYLIDPGTVGTWKSGSVSGVATRYVTFPQSGAGFNYGRTGQTWILSSSYNAFKESLSRLSQ